MSFDRKLLIDTLLRLNIEFSLHEHQAVFTTKDVIHLKQPIPGQDTKNLFLCDEKRRSFILVCVKADTRVRLKDLGRKLGIKGITFGSPKDMQDLLGVTPGSVCLFALANDINKNVKGYIDATIELDEFMQNHPLDNTATVVIKTNDMLRVTEHLHRPLERIKVPN